MQPLSGQQEHRLAVVVRSLLRDLYSFQNLGSVVVTREEFNHWLAAEKELIATLDDSESPDCK